MSLDQRIRDFYDDQALSGGELDAIQVRAEARPPGFQRGLVAGALIAASVITVLVLAYTLTRTPSEEPASDMILADPAPRQQELLVAEPPPSEVPAAPGSEEAGVDPGRGDGVLFVDSVPDGATIYHNGRMMGVTPMRIGGLDRSQPHTVAVFKAGYGKNKVTVRFGEQRIKEVFISLEVVERKDNLGSTASSSSARNNDTGGSASSASAGRASEGSGKGGTQRVERKEEGCSGNRGVLSVMAIGANNCKVTVGKTSLGLAPFFKKATPTGTCLVDLRCDEGLRYRRTMELKPGRSTKLIVKGNMWR